MRKICIGVLCIMTYALTPIFCDGYTESDLIAEKGIFPPDDPNSTAPYTPPPGQNQEAKQQKPLLPPEEPNDTTPAPGPSPDNDVNRPPMSPQTTNPRSTRPGTTNPQPSRQP